MSTVINENGQDRLLCKGASEYVVSECSHYIDVNGDRQPMQDTKVKEIKDIIDKYADAALRTIALAYRDLNEGDFGEKYSNP